VIGIWSAAVYAISLLEAGDAARAVQLMSECGDDEPMSKVPGPWRANWLDHYAGAQLALGDRPAAEHAAAEARKISDACGLAQTRMAADRAEAAVALDRGEAASAGALAVSSARAAASLGARIDEGFARILAGRALAETADRDDAIGELERAAAIFDECGAPRYRDQAEHELRKLGKSVHRRSERGSGEGIASLTGRELEVAELVVDRRTNPEIAAELFLSVKTVESHMRNIFRKLDVSSRVEVARIVEREARGLPAD
jgi:DNA-binding NarL/FixJ family response regulator